MKMDSMQDILRKVVWISIFLQQVLCIFGGNSFSWRSCGNSTDPIKIRQLDVFGNSSQSLFITGDIKVSYNLSSPIEGNIKMWRNVLGIWIPLPCLDDFGTCKYVNICSLSPYKTDCPAIYSDNNLPCHCPIQQGLYNFKGVPMNISILPGWIEKGKYSIKATFTSGNIRLLCIKFVIGI